MKISFLNYARLLVLVILAGAPFVCVHAADGYTWGTNTQTNYTITTPNSAITNTSFTVSNDVLQNSITQNITSTTPPPNGVTPGPSTYQLYPGFLAILGQRLAGLTNTSSLGDFLNAIIALVTAIGGVLAIVMIMYEGYSYMVARRDGEVVKMEGTRQNIVRIVIGFLLLLCIYVLLKTINPDLLNLVPSINGLTIAGQDGIGLVTNPAGTAPVAQSPNNNPAWVSQNGNIVQMQSPNGGTISIKPCDTTSLTHVTAFGHTFLTSKAIASSLGRIDTKWQQLGGNNFYRIPETVSDGSAMGSYNCELVPGTNTPAAHAYGLAIDINPAENSFGASLRTDMPAAFVKLFTDEGWGWGGNWHSKKDAMHFSKFTNEQGDMRASDNF